MSRLMNAVKGAPLAGTDSRGRPCPFCGSDKIDVLHAPLSGKMDGLHYWLYCRNCSASGPVTNVSNDVAVTLWNKRIPEAPTSQPAKEIP